MPLVPLLKSRQVVKAFEKLGWEVARQRGSHIILQDRKMIKDVKTKNLKVIPDERGRLMEILRQDDSFFLKFGQVYMTTTYPEVVKAWHKHEKQTDNVVCIQG